MRSQNTENRSIGKTNRRKTKAEAKGINTEFGVQLYFLSVFERFVAFTAGMIRSAAQKVERQVGIQTCIKEMFRGG